MATKQTREIYRGKAIIMDVSLEASDDWKDGERRDLPEHEKDNAFKIVYTVAEGDANGARHKVKIEISHRELKGKMLDYYRREDGAMPTQIDVAIRALVGQGFINRGATERDIERAIDDDLCGREVTIRVYDELGSDGEKWWPKCTFAPKINLVTGKDKSARFAAFLSGKPAPKREDAPAAANTAIPAPAEDDAGADLPF